MVNPLIHHGNFEAQFENRGRRIVWENGADTVLTSLSANHQTVTTPSITLPDATTLTTGWFVVLDITAATIVYLGDGATVGYSTSIPRFVIAILKDNGSVNGVWHFEVSTGSGNPTFSFSDFLNKGDVATGSPIAGDVGLASEFAYPLPSLLQAGLTTYSAFIRFRYKTGNTGTSLNLEVYNADTASVVLTTTIAPPLANSYFWHNTINFAIVPDNLYKLKMYRSGVGGGGNNVTLNIANLIVLVT
jgi:hypothetical protein